MRVMGKRRERREIRTYSTKDGGWIKCVCCESWLGRAENSRGIHVKEIGVVVVLSSVICGSQRMC